MRSVSLVVTFCLVTILCPGPSDAGQDQPPEAFMLSDLKTPAAPGFVLLGVAPGTIQRPTTPKAFAVSLLSAVAASNDLLPSDFSVELAPYWLKSRKQLSYREYTTPNLQQSLRQTFSMSLAFSRGSARRAGFTDHTDVSVGARLSILAGTATGSPRAVASKQAAYLVLEELLATARKSVLTDASVLTALDKIAQNSEFFRPDEKLSEDQQKQARADFAAGLNAIRQTIVAALQANDPMVQILTRLSAASEAELDSAALALQRANRRRAGWLLDVAAASAYRLGDNSVGDNQRVATGIWVTPGYRRADGRTDFVGAVRVINKALPVSGTVVDVGARLLEEVQNLSMSLEALYRVGDPVKGFSGRDQIDATFEYKVRDDLYVSATFGKGFNETSSPSNKGGLLGVLGLSLGFGEKPTVLVK